MAGVQDRFSQDGLSGNNTVAMNEDAVNLVQRGDLLVVTSGAYANQRMRVVGINRVEGVGSISDFIYVQCEYVE